MVSLAHLRLLASPTCVGFGTDADISTFRSFSRQRGVCGFRRLAPASLTALRIAGNGFAGFPPYSLRPGNSAPGPHSLLRPSFTPYRQYRNINLSSIDYAFRPRLRVRLTPGGRTFPGNPWVFGDRNSHPVFRYSCLHGHLYAVHLGSLFGFNPAYNALLPP